MLRSCTCKLTRTNIPKVSDKHLLLFIESPDTRWHELYSSMVPLKWHHIASSPTRRISTSCKNMFVSRWLARPLTFSDRPGVRLVATEILSTAPNSDFQRRVVRSKSVIRLTLDFFGPTRYGLIDKGFQHLPAVYQLYNWLGSKLSAKLAFRYFLVRPYVQQHGRKSLHPVPQNEFRHCLRSKVTKWLCV